jgi:predicted restriction endonuclease
VAVRSNHESFLRLACRTPTGKIRQISNYAQHHCPALYEYAKLVLTAEDGADHLRQAALAELRNDPKAVGVGETTRLALVEARLGQGKYREELLAIWGKTCALTGCNIEKILVASHTKPWAEAENHERLDPYNGFPFVAHVDKLFDSGLISFDNEGAMLVSKEIELTELTRIGLSHTDRLRTLDARHLPYLKAHRQQFGYE